MANFVAPPPHWLELVPAYLQAATLVPAVFAVGWTMWQYFVSGFTIRVRAYTDLDRKVVLLDMFNWGRISGSIEGCKIGEKKSWIKQPKRSRDLEKLVDLNFIEFEGEFKKTQLDPATSKRLTIEPKDGNEFPKSRNLRLRLVLGSGDIKDLKLNKKVPGNFRDAAQVPASEDIHVNQDIVRALATLQASRKRDLITQDVFNERRERILDELENRAKG